MQIYERHTLNGIESRESEREKSASTKGEKTFTISVFDIANINVRCSSLCVKASVERKLTSDHHFDEKKLKRRKKNEEMAIKTCSQPNFSLFFRRLR